MHLGFKSRTTSCASIGLTRDNIRQKVIIFFGLISLRGVSMDPLPDVLGRGSRGAMSFSLISGISANALNAIVLGHLASVGQNEHKGVLSKLDIVAPPQSLTRAGGERCSFHNSKNWKWTILRSLMALSCFNSFPSKKVCITVQHTRLIQKRTHCLILLSTTLRSILWLIRLAPLSYTMCGWIGNELRNN